MAGMDEPQPYLEPHTHQLEAASATMVTEAEGGDKDLVVDHKEQMSEGVVPMPGSQYAELGGVEPVNLISFAYQIASGMVCM